MKTVLLILTIFLTGLQWAQAQDDYEMFGEIERILPNPSNNWPVARCKAIDDFYRNYNPYIMRAGDQDLCLGLNSSEGIMLLIQYATGTENVSADGPGSGVRGYLISAYTTADLATRQRMEPILQSILANKDSSESARLLVFEIWNAFAEADTSGRIDKYLRTFRTAQSVLSLDSYPQPFRFSEAQLKAIINELKRERVNDTRAVTEAAATLALSLRTRDWPDSQKGAPRPPHILHVLQLLRFGHIQTVQEIASAITRLSLNTHLWPQTRSPLFQEEILEALLARSLGSEVVEPNGQMGTVNLLTALIADTVHQEALRDFNVRLKARLENLTVNNTHFRVNCAKALRPAAAAK